MDYVAPIFVCVLITAAIFGLLVWAWQEQQEDRVEMCGPCSYQNYQARCADVYICGPNGWINPYQ